MLYTLRRSFHRRDRPRKQCTRRGCQNRLMNISFRTLILALLIVACGQKQDQPDSGSGDNLEMSDNRALYDEVMEIHDEVMPKMNDLHKAKTTLQTRLGLPGLPKSEREVIEQKIAEIDSASEGMMVWMRQFQPVSDSVGEDSARAYLEKELIKVKQVREDILQALESVE